MNALHIYIVGICGTGTGALAGLLKSLGHKVVGSAATVYPPMSDKLAEWGIEVFEGYDAHHLALPYRPDVVIIGNVIRRENVEAQAAMAQQLNILSMPQAVAQFGIGERHSICVAGTHGKTTTTALIAHTALAAGCDPSFLVGGALQAYPESFRAGQGDLFIVEGDEYDTAFFDKGPKFLHYRAQTAIITSLEFDHADIFADVSAVERAFAKLIAQVPPTGHLVVWQGASRALDLIQTHAQTKKVTVYGTQAMPKEAQSAQLIATTYGTSSEGLTFTAVHNGEALGTFAVPLWGEFSVHNALSALAALLGVGLSAGAIREGFRTFGGVKRRMEVRGEPSHVTLVDDFAHHPTAVRMTLAAARERWPERRLWAVFEPRSATSRRNVFHAEYVKAFSQADCIIIGDHARLSEVPEAERFRPEQLARDLKLAGREAWAGSAPTAIAELLQHKARAGDVVMVLSNGDFGGLLPRLLTELQTLAV